MGRSCGGLTSNIHVLVGAESRPVILRLTGGQVANCTQADALTDELGEGDILLADKGYDSDAMWVKATRRKVWTNIPPKTNRKGFFAFFAVGLSAKESGRALLQQDQTAPRHRNSIQQAPGKLSRRRKNIVPEFMCRRRRTGSVQSRSNPSIAETNSPLVSSKPEPLQYQPAQEWCVRGYAPAHQPSCRLWK